MWRLCLWSRFLVAQERLDELDPAGFEVKARKVLSGLGFHDTMTVPPIISLTSITSFIHSFSKLLFCNILELTGIHPTIIEYF